MLEAHFTENICRGKPERSPCPYLNTLANHGFLPRDGFNITREQTNNAFDIVFNVDPAVTDSIFTAALPGSSSSSPDTINLADLNQHGRELFLLPRHSNLKKKKKLIKVCPLESADNDQSLSTTPLSREMTPLSATTSSSTRLSGTRCSPTSPTRSSPSRRWQQPVPTASTLLAPQTR